MGQDFDIYGGYDPTGGGDYSGGGGGIGGGDNGGGYGTTPVASITEVQLAEGGKLALAYGRHIVAGHLILHQTSPPVTIEQVLGEGEWDSVEKLWYKGQEILAADYHFHPGTLSTGLTDPIQGVDSFFPTGLTYSRTAYVAVKIPTGFAADNPPDQLRGIFKCKKVFDYDENGNQIGFGYSANAARVAADLIVVQAELPKSRIDWRQWAKFKRDCDELITWDDGTTVRSIPRFECHVVFTDGVSLADALNAVATTSAAIWQDDGEQIRFFSPLASQPIHHFQAGNILTDSVSFYQRGVTSRPNLARVKFRDLDSEFLTEATVPSEREDLRNIVGLVEAPIRLLPNCTYSQAQRLLERQMRLDSDNPLIVELTGLGDSQHVLHGDFVTASLPELDWEYQRCLVIEVEDEAAEKSPDHKSFILQAITGELYSDTDHKPIQKAVAV